MVVDGFFDSNQQTTELFFSWIICSTEPSEGMLYSIAILSRCIFYATCITVSRGHCILFSVVFTPSPPSHHGSVSVLPVVSLFLTNTVSPMRDCLII
jgi:hypothetical protein